MKLSQLLQDDLFIPPEWDREFADMVTDSRDVQAGDLFVARSGAVSHGADYINAAIQQGAVAVLQEADVGFRCDFGQTAVPVFSTPEVSAQLASWLYRRYPDAGQLPVLAVTGTNGKSSCVAYMAQLSRAQGKPCGVLGTLGNGIWPALTPTRNTTPDLSVVLRTLAQTTAQGAGRAAMEVSSHGLDQGRVAGMHFQGALLTNLTQDHLDYHGDMESYFQSKRRLLLDYNARFVVINRDCPYGQRLLADPEIPGQRFSYGEMTDQASTAPSDAGSAAIQSVSYRLLTLNRNGMCAELTTPWGCRQLELPLLGVFNLANAVAAITMLAAAGDDLDALTEAAAGLQSVAGRMDVYEPVSGTGPTVIIDFAHTPDALNSVLSSLQPWQQPLTLVFGCGGDRDRSKRPKMMAVAMQFADAIWLTDDNPRFEDPQRIFADALAVPGASEAGLHLEHDRTQAITQALADAPEQGLVVIAGKGHETWQEIAGVKHPFCDADVLAALGYVPRSPSPRGGQHAV
ncbi:UDP-N-acetylmuramoyl-L-alanyl-D-glutamate--2,6-diaminopimelate ligase [Oceanobacter sp. 5_MG-2023]|uniref:UDP-N-acetylmuramoyl-L-alanyl-D-glutamate--2, 6-diaminopimelate ligase n=1 Tax=Oceanobacter sp. 5_MG-2023 TaxID=3062645 RepID=UPI0026E27E0D|nr:UDP-N-acetylmuramoyl-L-alanyl-D-glutamate--2,6-diaminopimelate ligase [Oceanobacter sp. 5_MG-2023]MDO6682269.1 UDP-N-acetylmuramoyl-L-alanyl-D-glutamate--2,6-diaminopimelate ligase [Oceanobacter sp. 5_MG-2023]